MFDFIVAFTNIYVNLIMGRAIFFINMATKGDFLCKQSGYSNSDGIARDMCDKSFL